MSLTPSETFKQLVWAFPTPRKSSNNLFRPFRALENLQATCFGLSEPSKTFKQLVLAFPMRRKPSNNLFRPFRALGNLQTTCLGLSDPSGRQGRQPSLPGTVFLRYPSSFPAPAGAVRDASQVCRVRVFGGTRPASQPRQGPSGTSAKFAGYGFLRYPASFPAPAGGVRDACPVCRVRVF